MELPLLVRVRCPDVHTSATPVGIAAGVSPSADWHSHPLRLPPSGAAEVAVQTARLRRLVGSGHSSGRRCMRP